MGGGTKGPPGRAYGWNRSAENVTEVDAGGDLDEEDLEDVEDEELEEDEDEEAVDETAEACASAATCAWACSAARALPGLMELDMSAAWAWRADSELASEAAAAVAVCDLRWAIRSSPLENLRPQKADPCIQLHTWASEEELDLEREASEVGGAAAAEVETGGGTGGIPGREGKPMGGYPTLLAA